MSQVQLQVRPRRVRCSTACEPPPFRFAVGRQRERAGAVARVARLPLVGIALLLTLTGKVVDATFFLTAITVWCALHVTTWSYSFQIGPAADCFSLPCPPWLRTKVVIACVALAVLSFVASRVLNRFGHRATSTVLLLLVTLDLSALLLLGVRSVG